MQSDLFWNCPYLLRREDRDTGNIVLKKNRELEEITFKSLNKGHNVFKKLCLRSRSEEVRLDLEIFLRISPFLSKLQGELRDCCYTPHDQVDVFLDQFSPQLLHHLKQIVELGECVTASETEMKELNDLIDALGMNHLPIFSGPVFKPALDLHPEGEWSLVASIDIKAQNNAFEDDFDNPDPNIPIEEANSSPVDKNGQVMKNGNESRIKEPVSPSQDIKIPQRRMPCDKIKWEISKQRCSSCQKYFDANQRHVCTISNRKRTLSLAEDDKLHKDGRKIKERNTRDKSGENHSDHELKQEYIENDRSEPAKKSIKLKNELVNNSTSKQLKRGTTISEEHKKSCAPSLEESHPTGIKICSTSSHSLFPKETNPSFPLVGCIEESSLNMGDMAYAMHNNDQKEFKKCRITEKGASISTYKIQFEGSRTKTKRAGPSLTVPGKQLAYFESSKYELKVGTCCVAIWTEEPNDEERFFPAIVAESPTPENDYRYLIFFDDGYVEYFSLEDLRKIVDQETEDGKEGSCDSNFIENYLKLFPDNPVLPLAVGEQVEKYVIEEGRWVEARVVDIDASLVFIDCGGEYEREWIYRGHPRLRCIGAKSQCLDVDSDKKMSCIKGCGKEFISGEMLESHHAICFFKENEVVPCQLCEDANYKETNLSEHLYRKHENLKKQMMRSITDKFSPDTSIYTFEKQKRTWTCSMCGKEMKGNRTGVGFHWAVEHQQIKILYDSALKEKNNARKRLQREKCTEVREKLKLNSSGPTHPTDETVNSNNEFEGHSLIPDLKVSVKDETNLKDREIKESSSKQTEIYKLTTDAKEIIELSLEFETKELPMSSSLSQECEKERNACSTDVIISNKREMANLETSRLRIEASKHELGDFCNKLKNEVIEELWDHYLKFHPTQLKIQCEYSQEHTMRRQLFGESDSDRNSDTDFSD